MTKEEKQLRINKALENLSVFTKKYKEKEITLIDYLAILGPTKVDVCIIAASPNTEHKEGIAVVNDSSKGEVIVVNGKNRPVPRDTTIYIDKL